MDYIKERKLKLFVLGFILTTATPVFAETSLSLASDMMLGGLNSPIVQQLQKYLNTNGYTVNGISGEPGSVGFETNVFGTKTKQALIKFQGENGITPMLGYFGPKTRAKIAELENSGAVLGTTTFSTKKLIVTRKTLNQSELGTIKIDPPPFSGPVYNSKLQADEYSIEANSTIYVFANFPSNLAFVGWSGACNGSVRNDCEIKMSTDKKLTATFKGKRFFSGWSLTAGEEVIGIGIGRTW